MKIASVRRGALALGLLAGFAIAPAVAADKDPVVAVVNGTEIHASAVAAYQRTLPPQLAMQASFDQILDIVVTNQLIHDAAKKDGLAKDPEIQEMVRQFERQMLAKAWMNKKLKAAVTDEAVKKAYDEALAKYEPRPEVHARHILVESEDAAKAVIAELQKGADFAELAKKKSTDPSAKQNGGDLGYFGRDEMVKEFADAAFAMKPGEMSKQPVKSQFGWHVIKVEDTRMSTPPSFEQAKPMLREQVAEDAAEKLVADLRSKAKIKIVAPEGDAKK